MEDTEEPIIEYKSPEYIDGCLSVTGLPNSRWLALINLRIIKSRNKVVDIKPPKQAPFFLPTVAGLEPKFDRSEINGNLFYEKNDNKNDHFRNRRIKDFTQFGATDVTDYGFRSSNGEL